MHALYGERERRGSGEEMHERENYRYSAGYTFEKSSVRKIIVRVPFPIGAIGIRLTMI